MTVLCVLLCLWLSAVSFWWCSIQQELLDTVRTLTVFTAEDTRLHRLLQQLLRELTKRADNNFGVGIEVRRCMLVAELALCPDCVLTPTPMHDQVVGEDSEELDATVAVLELLSRWCAAPQLRGADANLKAASQRSLASSQHGLRYIGDPVVLVWAQVRDAPCSLFLVFVPQLVLL